MNTDIIVAMDVANRKELAAAVQRLPAQINWYKVGLELFSAEGPEALKPLQHMGKNIFLDLKLHDIPRTVEKAVLSVIPHQVQLLTVHASGGKAMLKAAAEAARSSPANQRLRLLAVTVLTSLDDGDLADMGIARSPSEQAVALAEIAYACGIDGVVCSVHEAASIRRALGPDALIATPGIRMPGAATEDQKRVATPGAARMAGASHLVVGRPIVDAADPEAAYLAIMKDLAAT